MEGEGSRTCDASVPRFPESGQTPAAHGARALRSPASAAPGGAAKHGPGPGAPLAAPASCAAPSRTETTRALRMDVAADAWPPTARNRPWSPWNGPRCSVRPRAHVLVGIDGDRDERVYQLNAPGAPWNFDEALVDLAQDPLGAQGAPQGSTSRLSILKCSPATDWYRGEHARPRTLTCRSFRARGTLVRE